MAAKDIKEPQIRMTEEAQILGTVTADADIRGGLEYVKKLNK